MSPFGIEPADWADALDARDVYLGDLHEIGREEAEDPAVRHRFARSRYGAHEPRERNPDDES